MKTFMMLFWGRFYGWISGQRVTFCVNILRLMRKPATKVSLRPKSFVDDRKLIVNVNCGRSKGVTIDDELKNREKEKVGCQFSRGILEEEASICASFTH